MFVFIFRYHLIATRVSPHRHTADRGPSLPSQPHPHSKEQLQGKSVCYHHLHVPSLTHLMASMLSVKRNLSLLQGDAH